MGVTWVVCGGPVIPFFGKKGERKLRAKIERSSRVYSEQRCMQVKTEMKRKVRKESGGGSKKRKEVGNESPLSSMFQKQQTANDLQKHESRIMQYLKRGKSWGWTR
jgi:hypothetical protein